MKTLQLAKGRAALLGALLPIVEEHISHLEGNPELMNVHAGQGDELPVWRQVLCRVVKRWVMCCAKVQLHSDLTCVVESKAASIVVQ